jgi:hypothetical protein
VIEGISSGTVADAEALWGADKWAGFAPAVQLSLLGGADIPTAGLDDDTLYLVTAEGGRDLDRDENRDPDDFGDPIFGRWHTVASGAQLKRPLVRVSVLTEAVYQALLPELQDLSDLEIRQRLDELARRVTGDINRDGDTDYLDVLGWSTLLNGEQYRGAQALLQRVRSDIEWDLDAGIRSDHGIAAVTRASWHPALPGGAYAGILVGCTVPSTFSDLCTLRELPLLGTFSDDPTVEDVMQRLVVSHGWMAERFEQFLRAMPTDLLKLTRSLTGVVIGAEVRPSYYESASGMIYLDADNFWLTDAERQTVSTEEDYRAEFEKQFIFADLWRYVRNSQSAFADSHDVDDDGNRQLDQALAPAAALMYHELAHANDYVPSSYYQELNPFLTLYEQPRVRPSDLLSGELPLQSSELRDLASALYRGAAPSQQQKNYRANEIGRLFEPDGANDLYAYSSQREDLAMLFEEFMMRRNYQLERDVGFTTIPAVERDEPLCEDFTVQWGVRGRIGAAHLRPRLHMALEELLPGEDFAGEVSRLPPPRPMQTGRDWCENLLLDTGGESRRPGVAALRKPARAPVRGPRPYL